MKLLFCAICGTNKNLQHHHIVPKAEGGDNHEWNYLTLCFHHHNFIHNIRRTMVKGHFKSLCELSKTRENYNKGGRPRTSKDKEDMVIYLRQQGLSLRQVSAQTGLAVGTIRKIEERHQPKEVDEYLELYAVGGCD